MFKERKKEELQTREKDGFVSRLQKNTKIKTKHKNKSKKEETKRKKTKNNNTFSFCTFQSSLHTKGLSLIVKKNEVIK